VILDEYGDVMELVDALAAAPGDPGDRREPSVARPKTP
jgi:hypothetical protein